MRRLLFLLCLPLAACGIRYDVRTDFDPAVDFSSYRSFSVPPRDRPDTPNALDNSLTMKRIEAMVVRQLEARGLTRVAADADLTIRFWVTSRERTEVSSVPVMSPFYGPYMGPFPYPYSFGRWGPMYDEVVVRRHEEGTLVLDLLDPRRNGELVWRTYVVGRLQRDRDEAFAALEQALARGLADYPPRR